MRISTASTSNPANIEAPVVASRLPNFFIVGAPKAGTTSLYHYLDQHPEVYMSPIKEPNYFSPEIRIDNIDANWQEWAQREDKSLQQYLRGSMEEKRFGGIVSNFSDYQKLFRNVTSEKAVGEASVCYLWSETAARNIALTTPDAKIIMVLRNPVDRAFSQYKQAVVEGLTGKSFHELLRTSLTHKSEKFALLNPFLEFGLYHEQVKRYTELFPPANLRIYLYEDYKRAPRETLTHLFDFLGVDSQFSPDMSEKHLRTNLPRFLWISHMLKKHRIWTSFKNAVPGPLVPIVRRWVLHDRHSEKLEPVDRALLIGYYQMDILRLSTLIGRDLHEWMLSPQSPQ